MCLRKTLPSLLGLIRAPGSRAFLGDAFFQPPVVMAVVAVARKRRNARTDAHRQAGTARTNARRHARTETQRYRATHPQRHTIRHTIRQSDAPRKTHTDTNTQTHPHTHQHTQTHTHEQTNTQTHRHTHTHTHTASPRYSVPLLRDKGQAMLKARGLGDGFGQCWAFVFLRFFSGFPLKPWNK